MVKFSIKRLFIHPHIAKFTYYHVDHTREDASATHGPNDLDLIRKKSLYAPWILKTLKIWMLGNRPWIYNKKKHIENI